MIKAIQSRRAFLKSAITFQSQLRLWTANIFNCWQNTYGTYDHRNSEFSVHASRFPYLKRHNRTDTDLLTQAFWSFFDKMLVAKSVRIDYQLTCFKTNMAKKHSHKKVILLPFCNFLKSKNSPLKELSYTTATRTCRCRVSYILPHSDVFITLIEIFLYSKSSMKNAVKVLSSSCSCSGANSTLFSGFASKNILFSLPTVFSRSLNFLQT